MQFLFPLVFLARLFGVCPYALNRGIFQRSPYSEFYLIIRSILFLLIAPTYAFVRVSAGMQREGPAGTSTVMVLLATLYFIHSLFSCLPIFISRHVLINQFNTLWLKGTKLLQIQSNEAKSFLFTSIASVCFILIFSILTFLTGFYSIFNAVFLANSSAINGLFIAKLKVLDILYKNLNRTLIIAGETKVSQEKIRELLTLESELKNVCETLDGIFGPSNILYTWSVLATITYTEILFVQEGYGMLESPDNVMAAIINVCVPLCLANSCDVVRQEAHKTGKLLHELFIENDDRLIRHEIEIFALQLLHRNVDFSACGFFKIDYTLISSLVGTVTTYIVILVQFQTDTKR